MSFSSNVLVLTCLNVFCWFRCLYPCRKRCHNGFPLEVWIEITKYYLEVLQILNSRLYVLSALSLTVADAAKVELEAILRLETLNVTIAVQIYSKIHSLVQIHKRDKQKIRIPNVLIRVVDILLRSGLSLESSVTWHSILYYWLWCLPYWKKLIIKILPQFMTSRYNHVT